MQLKSTGRDEGIAWVKVLENIITVVDPVKLETSTNGEWRSALCRCLTLLVRNEQSGTSSLNLLCYV
jgi:nucleolar pre-ribosomal-associated protein 1